LELRAESTARQWMSNIFDSHKVVGLTERCGGSSFRLRGKAACRCNTAAESRRESALVDAKDIRLPFSASHCPVSDHEIQGQGSQAGASMSPWKTLGKLQLRHSDKTLIRNWLDFAVRQPASPLSAPGRADCFLLSAQRYIRYCASQPTVYTSGRPGCALMHF
jgi:hypothetical protein